MNCDNSSQISARLAVIELRSLIVANASMPLDRQYCLVHIALELSHSQLATNIIERHLNRLIARRTGRNPDTFQVCAATAEALDLLEALQSGSLTL